MVRTVDLFDQIFVFSLKTLGEEKGGCISENGNKLRLRWIKLYMTNFGFIRVESAINFEVRIIMSVKIANKRAHIMYTVEPDLWLSFFFTFLSTCNKGWHVVHKKFSYLKPEVLLLGKLTYSSLM